MVYVKTYESFFGLFKNDDEKFISNIMKQKENITNIDHRTAGYGGSKHIIEFSLGDDKFKIDRQYDSMGSSEARMYIKGLSFKDGVKKLFNYLYKKYQSQKEKDNFIEDNKDRQRLSSYIEKKGFNKNINQFIIDISYTASLIKDIKNFTLLTDGMSIKVESIDYGDGSDLIDLVFIDLKKETITVKTKMSEIQCDINKKEIRTSKKLRKEVKKWKDKEESNKKKRMIKKFDVL